MVDFTNKQVNVNILSNFDATPIQIVAPINLSNVGLTATGDSGTIGGSSSSSSGSGSGGSNAQLEIGANSTIALSLRGGTVSTFTVDSAGNGTFLGTVTAQAFLTASDMRLKTNIQRITDYETIVSSVNGVRFEWADTGAKDIGVIAQELEQTLPDAVYRDHRGYLQVSYPKLIPVLLEAIKGLQGRVSTLEGRV
jgi:hypothetical protein